MSDKKSKSKSKQKAGDKPPKDAKSKKSKQDKDDTKSKKSLQKADKGSKDKGSKGDKGSKAGKGDKASKADKLQNSRISKIDQNASQSDFSIFKPFHQPPPRIDQSLCPYHNEPNTNFCQICQQVGCGSCVVYGPHNNQMHKITKLDQAFKSRYLYLNEIVCNDLLQKRDKMNKKLQDMNVLSDELRYVKGAIQKQTKIQFNDAMQKLNISAGNKFAILNHQMACLQQDLQSINLLGNQFFQLTNVNPQNTTIPQTNPNKGMVPFLLKARVLQEQAQQLISRPIKTSVDVFPYDLPRQVTQKKLILQKNRGWLDLLKVKDQVIWQLLEQKKLVSHSLWDNFYEDTNNQIQQWQKLNDKLKQQIHEYQLKCRQCGILMDQNSINQTCEGREDVYHYFQ